MKKKDVPKALAWLREKRLLQAIEPEQKFREDYQAKEKDASFFKKKITMTKKITNGKSNFKMFTYNYFEYHWCVLEMKIKNKQKEHASYSLTGNAALPFDLFFNSGGKDWFAKNTDIFTMLTRIIFHCHLDNWQHRTCRNAEFATSSLHLHKKSRLLEVPMAQSLDLTKVVKERGPLWPKTCLFFIKDGWNIRKTF